MLISEKGDFKTRKIISIKRALHNDNKSVFQEGTTVLKGHVPNNRASTYVRQTLIKTREIEKSITISGDLKTHPSIINKPIRQKINKNIV